MKEVVKQRKTKDIGYKKPPIPGPGRPKGSKNKFTDLKQAYLDVFEKIEVEGKKKNNQVKTLYMWATKNDKNQGIFYQMISKMLPSSLDVDHRGHIALTLSDKFLPDMDNGSKPK